VSLFSKSYQHPETELFDINISHFIYLSLLQTDAPGPGSYVGHIKVDNGSVSISKKGTGGFASKVSYAFS